MTAADAEMRLAYLATEHAPGGQLVIDAPGSYSIKAMEGARSNLDDPGKMPKADR